MSKDTVKNMFSFVGGLLGGFIAVALAIHQLVYAPLNGAICDEVNKREKAVQDESDKREKDKIEIVKFLGNKLDKIMDCQTAQACSIAQIKEKLKINDQPK